MLNLKIGTNTQRKTDIVDENVVTPKAALEKHGIDFSRATIHLDGSVLTAAEMNKTFADLGVKDNAYLVAVIKSDNAA